MTNYSSTYQQKIKLYADGADFDSMITLAKDPNITGLTTNPSLMKKAGVTEYTPFCKKVLEHIKDKPLSFETFADDFPTISEQAKEIATWGENVYVKIPVTNSKGESAAPLIKELSNNNVKLNVTAIFTIQQVKEVCEALKGGAPSIVSVFAGRIADVGIDPIPLMKEALEICKNTGPQVELLWASTREVFNVIEAERMGCHIITAPPAVLSKMKNIGKTLEECSLDTIKTFKNDAEAVGYTI